MHSINQGGVVNYFNQLFKGAIIDDDLPQVKELIQTVGPNAADEYGVTPLHYAIIGERTQITELLLEAGADPEAQDAQGMKPFDLRKPVVEKRDQHRLTVHQAAAAGNQEQVKAYIAMGGDLQATDHGNFTPLQHAANAGHSQIVTDLIDAGADINAHRGSTPAVHLAAKSGSLNALVALLNAGANPIEQDPLHRTAMHLAAESGSIACIQALIDTGSDLNAIDILQRSPLDVAVANGRDEAAALLAANNFQHAPEQKQVTITDEESRSYKERLLNNASLTYVVGRGDEQPQMRSRRHAM
ncbi:ankyrin repeat domain-containing protein [Stenotrophomonas maltophilia]|nr:ankyrin repeat domain-containing protein [Stenotrophomonas maltophilia]MBA0267326.1 ankyrin repeat domain-containing protein [Stenotrophomonas maltophilia]